MAKNMCKACNKGCRSDVTYVCDHTCCDCFTNPPCISTGPRVPCSDCNIYFRSPSCFENLKKRSRANAKSVCHRKKCCSRCGGNKRYCGNCQQNKEIGHQCYTQLLTNVLPSDDGVLYVFYDFETTQNSRFSDKATLHVRNLVCLQKFCSRCEGVTDTNIDCFQCGSRRHSSETTL
jgi:hypothetical protein